MRSLVLVLLAACHGGGVPAPDAFVGIHDLVACDQAREMPETVVGERPGAAQIECRYTLDTRHVGEHVVRHLTARVEACGRMNRE